MKKTNPLIMLLAAAACVACSSDSLDVQENTSQAGQDGPVPINFSVYTSRGLTRNGAIGTLTDDGLKDPKSKFGEAGFGVFAYYTNADDYASDARPNFMFNQQVKYTYYDEENKKGVFDYSPVRYWPNEYGETAMSEDIDKLSFFAYAPYVKVNPATGYLSDPGELNEGTTWGITGTSRNTYTGDPLVKYVTTFEMENSVDLCWGVYNEGESGWATMNGKQTTTNGLPWLNVQHAQSVDQRLKFTFLHATSQLNVRIDANVDDSEAISGGYSTDLGTHDRTGEKDENTPTKIFVRSITFTGIAAQGALNLNNVKAGMPLWMNYTGTGWIENGQSVTIHDGLRDGFEGTENAEANSETMTGLNPIIISNYKNTHDGVTKTSVNLFGRKEGTTELDEGVYVIPTGEQVRMTIVYDVETAVDDLPGYLSDGVTHGISIENRISTDLKYNGKALTFEGGKSYTIRLHLGMNSVKFDAEVNDDWEVGAAIDVPRDDIDLSNIWQSDIEKYRGDDDNPRAWVICEEGGLHLCQGGKEVDKTSDPADPIYIDDGNETGLSCNKKKVAVVCCVSTSKVDTSEGAGSYRGLALALEDATTDIMGCQWYTSNSDKCVTSYSEYPGKEIDRAAHLAGIMATEQLGNATGDCDGHNHAAAKAALNYSSATPTGTAISRATPESTSGAVASGWFLPTISQWSLIVKGLTGSADELKSIYDGNEEGNQDYQDEKINKYIEAAGGTGLNQTTYWSSTEYRETGDGDKHGAWQISFVKGYASFSDKSENSCVRPVLAF